MSDPLGDFQTPEALASEVWRCLDATGVDVFIEPTVGEGVFLATVPQAFAGVPWLAWDINPAYVERTAAVATARRLHATIAVEDTFDLDRESLAATIRDRTVLAIGNPPWVTSASQASVERKNLPRKWNRFGLRGLDAVTGKANFDTAEAVLLAVIDALREAREIRLAFLIKRSVALKMSRDLLGTGGVIRASFSRIDAKRSFGAAVEAGLFELVIQPGVSVGCTALRMRPSLGASTNEVAGLVDGRFVPDIAAYQAARGAEAAPGTGLIWRQGIKHDLARVLELRATSDGHWENGSGEAVDVEPEVLCPLFKSSDLAVGRPAGRCFPLYQFDLSGPVPDLRERWPKLARYLDSHSDRFDERGSSIYRGKPDFMLFGVGDYTRAPYKVAISGFYKKPSFRVLGSEGDGPPPLVDDTCYLLPFSRLDQAEAMAAHLNSAAVQTLLAALADRTAKRPYTKEVLGRIAAPTLWIGEAA